MVAGLHFIPDGLRSPAVPASFGVPEDEGHPGYDTRHRFPGVLCAYAVDKADVPLEWIDATAEEIRPFEEAGEERCDRLYEKLSFSESEGASYDP